MFGCVLGAKKFEIFVFGICLGAFWGCLGVLWLLMPKTVFGVVRAMPRVVWEYIDFFMFHIMLCKKNY